MNLNHNLKISIIGSGIGGLTTAIALQQKEFRTEVFEAAVEIKAVGAGIILAPNAMTVYKHLGLYDRIVSAGNKISALTITDPNLKTIVKNDLQTWENQTGVSAVAISRTALQEILLSVFSPHKVNLNKKVKNYQETDTGVLVHFDDNSEKHTDILIGADGINSAVRKTMFPNVSLRNADQWCWRGLCDFEIPENYPNGLFELWGVGKRFGFVQVNARQVYWYALTNKSVLEKKSNISNLKVAFKEFNPLVSRLLDATSEADVIQGVIQDIKLLHAWFSANVCLIGDAAHPTTPNLGQGACQAIEDAYILAEMFSSSETVQNCFAQFHEVRKRKVSFVVNTSWRLGKMAQLNSSFLCHMRNSMLRLMPPGASAKTNTMVYNLEL